jgi:hypothetical protein
MCYKFGAFHRNSEWPLPDWLALLRCDVITRVSNHSIYSITYLTIWFKVPQVIVKLEAIRTCYSRATNVTQGSENILSNPVLLHSMTASQIQQYQRSFQI